MRIAITDFKQTQGAFYVASLFSVMVAQKMVRIEAGKMTDETKKMLEEMKKNLQELQRSVESYKIELETQVNKVANGAL